MTETLASVMERVLVEIAEAMDWPLDPKSRWFYQLAEVLPPAATKELIVDAVSAAILSPDEARRLLVVLDLEAA